MGLKVDRHVFQRRYIQSGKMNVCIIFKFLAVLVLIVLLIGTCITKHCYLIIRFTNKSNTLPALTGKVFMESSKERKYCITKEFFS